MKITQVELLTTISGSTVRYLVCWLPAEHNWKNGMKVQLKDDLENIWTVAGVFSTQENYELNRKWDVGGL